MRDRASQPGEHVQRGVGWLPLSLRLPILLTFILVDVAIVVCLITLCVWSSAHYGFATINSQSVSLLNFNWNLGLLWTTLPVLVFRLLGICWEWITSPISQRQPYVDLLENGGAPAKRSILLDYLAVPIFWRWCTALKNRHFLVSACSLLTLLMSIVVSALSARLFAVRTIPITQTVPILFNTTFNESAVDAHVDWIPVLDSVSAILVHDGVSLGWTDQQYAFKPYEAQTTAAPGDVVTAYTDAYSAYLNCSILTDYSLSLRDSRLYMTASDRGCDINQDFIVSDAQKSYFQTSSINTCSAKNWYGRLIFTSAEYSNKSNNNVTNVSVLSCISAYRSSSGNLKVVFKNGTSSVPSIQDFQPSVVNDTRITFWRVIEQSMLSAKSYNPTAVSSTSVFGTVVLYYAQKLAGSQNLSAKILDRAISDVFTAAYLSAVAKNSFAPLQTPSRVDGQVTRLTDRLYTVNGVVYVIVVILGFTICTALYAIRHVNTRTSVLEEEPAGLLAHAAILDSSPLLNVAAEMKMRNGRELSKNAKKGEFKNTRWGALAAENKAGWTITRLG